MSKTNLIVNSSTQTGAITIAKEAAKKAARMEFVGYALHNRRQVENMRTFFNKKKQSVKITNIKVLADGTLKFSVLNAQHNIETRLLDIHNNFLVMTSSKTVRQLDGFTPDIINLDLSKAKDIERYGMRLFCVNFDGGFTRRFYLERAEGKDKVFDCQSNKVVDSSVVYDVDGGIKAGVYAYSGHETGGQNSSASQVRKGNITLAANQDLERMIDRLNFVTYGAQELLDGELVTASGLVKSAARFGQYKAPSCYQDFHVKTAAFYMDKWVDANGNEYRDGSIGLASEYLADAFSAKDTKFQVRDRAVSGIPAQVRPWFIKGMGVASRRSYLKLWAEFKGWEIVHISRDAVTEEIQAEFNKCFSDDKAVKKSSTLWGKLVIVTDTAADDIWAIDSMSDLNALKYTFDLSSSSGLNMLDMGKAVRDLTRGANTAMQPLQSLLFLNPIAGREWIKNTAMGHMQNVINTTYSAEARVPSIEEFGRYFGANTLPKFAPSFCFDKHAKMYQSISNNMLQGLSRDITQLSFGVPGAHLKIHPDFGMDFNNMFIDAGEVFAPAAERYFTEIGLPQEEWIISMFKYPKMHVLEYGCDKVVSLEAVIARIGASSLSKAIKRELIALYRTISESMIIVPAIEINKKKLAGMDYDADALTAIFDVAFNEIMGLQTPMAISIEGVIKSVEKAEHVFTRNAGWRAFVQIVKNENKSIGEITIMNDIFVALLVMLLMDQEPNAAKVVLEKTFAGDHIVEVYESALTISQDEEYPEIPVQAITPALADTITENIKGMELTKDNMILALLDLVSVNRMLQERTIDAAKNNEKVEVPFDVNKVAQLLSRTPVNVRINWNTSKDEEDYDILSDGSNMAEWKGVKFDIDLGSKNENGSEVRYIETRSGKRVPKFFVMDEFQRIRIDLARELCKTAAEIRGREQGFDDIEITMFQEVSTSVGALVRNAVVQAKLIYDDLTGIMRREILGKEDEEKSLINAQYQQDIAELSNHIRRLTKELSPVERAMLLIDVAEKSNFAFTCCAEEFTLFVVEKFAEVNFAGEKLDRCDFELGESVPFIGGIASVDGKLALTKGNLTGEFVIREHNGSKYASKLISELVVVPAIDETKCVFKTSWRNNNVQEIAKQVTGGAVVKLSQQKDSIFVEDKYVGQFDCQDHGNQPMSAMYRDMQGIVKRAVMGETTGINNKRTNKVLIVVLQDMAAAVLSDDTLKQAKEVEAQERATKKASFKSKIKFITNTTGAAY
jgi:hypothetical protein